MAHGCTCKGREKEPIISNKYGNNLFYLSKHLKKVYPIELHKTCSHTFINDFSSPLDHKKREILHNNIVVPQVIPCPNEKELMRCSWITNSTGKFHLALLFFSFHYKKIWNLSEIPSYLANWIFLLYI